MSLIANRKKNKFKAAPYLIATLIFFGGGFLEMNEDRFYFSLVIFSASLINLLVIKTSDRNIANFIVMILNAVLALVLIVLKAMVDEQNQYFLYLWILMFFLFASVAIIAYQNYQKGKKEVQESIPETETAGE